MGDEEVAEDKEFRTQADHWNELQEMHETGYVTDEEFKEYSDNINNRVYENDHRSMKEIFTADKADVLEEGQTQAEPVVTGTYNQTTYLGDGGSMTQRGGEISFSSENELMTPERQVEMDKLDEQFRNNHISSQEYFDEKNRMRRQWRNEDIQAANKESATLAQESQTTHEALVDGTGVETSSPAQDVGGMDTPPEPVAQTPQFDFESKDILDSRTVTLENGLSGQVNIHMDGSTSVQMNNYADRVNAKMNAAERMGAMEDAKAEFSNSPEVQKIAADQKEAYEAFRNEYGTQEMAASTTETSIPAQETSTAPETSMEHEGVGMSSDAPAMEVADAPQPSVDRSFDEMLSDLNGTPVTESYVTDVRFEDGKLVGQISNNPVNISFDFDGGTPQEALDLMADSPDPSARAVAETARHALDGGGQYVNVSATYADGSRYTRDGRFESIRHPDGSMDIRDISTGKVQSIDKDGNLIEGGTPQEQVQEQVQETVQEPVQEQIDAAVSEPAKDISQPEQTIADEEIAQEAGTPEQAPQQAPRPYEPTPEQQQVWEEQDRHWEERGYGQDAPTQPTAEQQQVWEAQDKHWQDRGYGKDGVETMRQSTGNVVDPASNFTPQDVHVQTADGLSGDFYMDANGNIQVFSDSIQGAPGMSPAEKVDAFMSEPSVQDAMLKAQSDGTILRSDVDGLELRRDFTINTPEGPVNATMTMDMEGKADITFKDGSFETTEDYFKAEAEAFQSPEAQAIQKSMDSCRNVLNNQFSTIQDRIANLPGLEASPATTLERMESSAFTSELPDGRVSYRSVSVGDMMEANESLLSMPDDKLAGNLNALGQTSPEAANLLSDIISGPGMKAILAAVTVAGIALLLMKMNSRGKEGREHQNQAERNVQPPEQGSKEVADGPTRNDSPARKDAVANDQPGSGDQNASGQGGVKISPAMEADLEMPDDGHDETPERPQVNEPDLGKGHGKDGREQDIRKDAESLDDRGHGDGDIWEEVHEEEIPSPAVSDVPEKAQPEKDDATQGRAADGGAGPSRGMEGSSDRGDVGSKGEAAGPDVAAAVAVDAHATADGHAQEAAPEMAREVQETARITYEVDKTTGTLVLGGDITKKGLEHLIAKVEADALANGYKIDNIVVGNETRSFQPCALAAFDGRSGNSPVNPTGLLLDIDREHKDAYASIEKCRAMAVPESVVNLAVRNYAPDACLSIADQNTFKHYNAAIFSDVDYVPKDFLAFGVTDMVLQRDTDPDHRMAIGENAFGQAGPDDVKILKTQDPERMQDDGKEKDQTRTEHEEVEERLKPLTHRLDCPHGGWLLDEKDSLASLDRINAALNRNSIDRIEALSQQRAELAAKLEDFASNAKPSPQAVLDEYRKTAEYAQRKQELEAGKVEGRNLTNWTSGQSGGTATRKESLAEMRARVDELIKEYRELGVPEGSDEIRKLEDLNRYDFKQERADLVNSFKDRYLDAVACHEYMQTPEFAKKLTESAKVEDISGYKEAVKAIAQMDSEIDALRRGQHGLLTTEQQKYVSKARESQEMAVSLHVSSYGRSAFENQDVRFIPGADEKRCVGNLERRIAASGNDAEKEGLRKLAESVLQGEVAVIPNGMKVDAFSLANIGLKGVVEDVDSHIDLDVEKKRYEAAMAKLTSDRDRMLADGEDTTQIDQQIKEKKVAFEGRLRAMLGPDASDRAIIDKDAVKNNGALTTTMLERDGNTQREMTAGCGQKSPDKGMIVNYSTMPPGKYKATDLEDVKRKQEKKERRAGIGRGVVAGVGGVFSGLTDKDLTTTAAVAYAVGFPLLCIASLGEKLAKKGINLFKEWKDGGKMPDPRKLYNLKGDSAEIEKRGGLARYELASAIALAASRTSAADMTQDIRNIVEHADIDNPHASNVVEGDKDVQTLARRLVNSDYNIEQLTRKLFEIQATEGDRSQVVEQMKGELAHRIREMQEQIRGEGRNAGSNSLYNRNTRIINENFNNRLSGFEKDLATRKAAAADSSRNGSKDAKNGPGKGHEGRKGGAGRNPDNGRPASGRKGNGKDPDKVRNKASQDRKDGHSTRPMTRSMQIKTKEINKQNAGRPSSRAGKNGSQSGSGKDR